MATPPPLDTTVSSDSFPPRDSWTGLVLLDRYRVGERVGSGGFGVVYRAEDTVDGQTVAVKVHFSNHDTALERLRREIAALRHLKIPGVVQFLDSGVFEGTPFFVMEFVEGSPFPGASVAIGDWERLEPVVVAILEALSRLHQRTFVHRDLKPSNVLVDSRGVPTILDFGLAWSPELGGRLTNPGRFVGTLSYLAPEQLGGSVIERRADLFSFGVLLYEALAGKLPFPSLDFNELAHQKLHLTPEPLHRLDERVPRHISDLVQRLLSPAPLSRPEDATEVLSVIRGERASFDVLPWIDSSRLEARVLEAFENRESFDIVGGPGSGRTRSLDEIARLAKERGLETRYTVAATSAFGSLEIALIDSRGDGDGTGERVTIEDKSREIEAQLDQLVGRGVILLVDDAHRIDRWSARAIERARERGLVIRTLHSGPKGAHTLVPLSERSLRSLFRGHDRVFHLREDAAEQLFLRTDGVPDLVHEELAAWERAGVCVRSEEGWTISRSEIDQLAAGFESAASLRVSKLRQALTHEQEDLLAWIDLAFPHARPAALASLTEQELWQVEAQLAELRERNLIRVSEEGGFVALVTGLAVQIWDDEQLREAHRLLVDHLPRGSANRLFHMLEADSEDTELVEEAVEEVVACAERLIELERTGEAIAALSNGLKFVRAQGGPEKVLAVLEVWARAAMRATDLSQLEALEAVLVSLSSEESRCDSLREHVAAWIASMRTGGEEVLARIRALSPYPNPKLERYRGVAMISASGGLLPARQREVLDRLLEWNAESCRRWLEEMLPNWRGRVSYREGEFERSASEYLEAAERTESRSGRAVAWLNVAYAQLELAHGDRGRHSVERAFQCLEGTRAPMLELRCHGLLRKIAYRQCEELALDPELIEIARAAQPSISASIHLGEAAIAFRLGEREAAGRWASEAHEAWRATGQTEPATLAQVLFRYCCADFDFDPAPSVELACHSASPGISAQILALLARCHVDIPREELRARCEAFPRAVWQLRREVLSIEECREAL